MRAAFGAGVFVGFLDEGLDSEAFDGLFGVSAGALNTMYWISRARDGVRVYDEDLLRVGTTPFFLFGSVAHLAYRLARGRPAIDLRAVVHAMRVTHPIDIPRVLAHPTPVWFPVTNARTLSTEFLDARSLPEDMLVPMLAAASSVPALADPFEFEQSAWIDGACGAPLPVDEALRRGFTDLVVVLNLPLEQHPTWYEPLLLRALSGPRGLSPDLARLVSSGRAARRAALRWLVHMPKHLRVTVIAPPVQPGRTLEREAHIVRRSIAVGNATGSNWVRRARYAGR